MDELNFKQSFQGRLRRLREKERLSQAELARLVGVKTHTVWRWEAGERTPHLKEMARIAAALHVTEAELLNAATA